MKEPGSEPPGPTHGQGVPQSAVPGVRGSEGSAPEDRRHPLRFVWQIDAEDRFTIESDEFLDLVGPTTPAILGRPWPEIAAALDLDLEGHIERAIATGDTWSGLCATWPVDGTEERLNVELSGLPVFDRSRTFRGYRGFGVCREIARLCALARTRQHGSSSAPSPRENVVLFRTVPAIQPGPPVQPEPPPPPTLTPVEQRAFWELSRRLSERLYAGRNGHDPKAGFPDGDLPSEPATANGGMPWPEQASRPLVTPGPGTAAQAIFDRFPSGVLIYRLNELLYANRAFLDWAGHENLTSLAAAGGLDSLFVGSGEGFGESAEQSFVLTSPHRGAASAEARLFPVPWDGDSAFALVTTLNAPKDHASDSEQRLAPAPTEEEIAATRDEAATLAEMLDATSDGVVLLDRNARILRTNQAADAMLDQRAGSLVGRSLKDLLSADQIDAALTILDTGPDPAGATHRARVFVARARDGRMIPLSLTMSRLQGRGDTVCAVLRAGAHTPDATETSAADSPNRLAAAKREKPFAAQADFLGRVSHEIRAPLNSIVGFSEMMLEERFGALENERYRQYLTDIHASGGHLIALVNDLLDVSRIESGTLELAFADVALNELIQHCVATMQPQANRAHIIIRTALAPKLPMVSADAGTLQQVLLNVLAQAIAIAGQGGQVIVSTAAEAGEVIVHVRDTSSGMSEQDIARALEPFGQTATSPSSGTGTGLALLLSNALTEANRGKFSMSSAPNAGTLVEIRFPTMPPVS
jgi:PAS domain S-box-containing protein